LNFRWDIINNILNDKFEEEKDMLDEHNEEQELEEIPSTGDGLLILFKRKCISNVFSLLSCYPADEESLIDLAREVNGCAVDDDGQLAQVLEAAQPVPNTIGYFCLESPLILQVGNL